MQPNEIAIRQHLEFLFSGMDDYQDGRFEISILNDSENFIYGSIDEAVKKAAQWNQQGKNVYTVGSIMDPNTAPFGRNSDSDFYATNVLWCDIDQPTDIPSLKGKYAHCPPSMVIITGRTPHVRMHLWWKLDEAITDPFALRRALQGIQAALGGDPAAKNPTRLMRLGGSVAWPTKEGRVKELTEVIVPSNAKITTLDMIQTAYPIPEPREKPTLNLDTPKKSLSLTSEWSQNDIINMLRYVDADKHYHDWLQIGMALKDGGYDFHVWDNWSSRGSTYDQQIMDKKWASFKGAGTTIGTLVHFAKEGGWTPEPQRPSLPAVITPPPVTYNLETGEIHDETENQSVNGLYFLRASQITPSLDANDFVQGLLSESALSVIYGPSNCGKTFFVTDLCFHVALGQRWRNKRVERGGVVYVALEGSTGLKNRVAAFSQEVQQLPDNFTIVPCQVNFLAPDGNINDFIELLKLAKKQVGDIKLVVIDTLARAMAGGDENAGQDMGMLVHHADRIRAETGSHVCFVHHSGKDEARGARGHSSLRAAVDTEIEISRSEGAEYSSVKVVKQREMAMDDEMYFGLHKVSLGLNPYKEEVTSCIVKPLEEPTVKVQKRDMSPIQQFVYDSIVAAISYVGIDSNLGSEYGTQKTITYDQFRERLEYRGFKDLFGKDGGDDKVKSATQAARLALKTMGKINFNRSHIWLIKKEEN